MSDSQNNNLEYLLYVSVNKINGKIYGGKHVKRTNKKYYGSGKFLKLAWMKYGKENFEMRWFKLKIKSNKDLHRLEIRLIRRLVNKFGKSNCYNCHKGGNGGFWMEYADKDAYEAYTKNVSLGLKNMYKIKLSNPDSKEYKSWKRGLYARKETIRKRTIEFGKTEKENRKREFQREKGFYEVTYKIVYPDNSEIIETNNLSKFLLKYNTEDHIFSRLRKYPSDPYIFKKITKLTKHPFPKNTKIYFVSEIKCFDAYRMEFNS